MSGVQAAEGKYHDDGEAGGIRAGHGSPVVILSGVAASQREAATESKDPYLLHAFCCLADLCVSNSGHGRRDDGSFDFTNPFASEWVGCAQDDNNSQRPNPAHSESS